MKRPAQRAYGSKPMTKAQNLASYKLWLNNCRDTALVTWPAEEIARSYGLKVEDVRADIEAQKKARGL